MLTYSVPCAVQSAIVSAQVLGDDLPADAAGIADLIASDPHLAECLARHDGDEAAKRKLVLDSVAVVLGH
jgi:hypothetical protein